MTAAPRTTNPLDGTRTYTYPPTGEEFTSVTTVLAATSSKPWLTSWAARLAAEYAVANLFALTELAGRGSDGYDQAVKLVKQQAQQARERKADTGSYVHAVTEALVLWAASPGGCGGDIILPLLPEHLHGAPYDEQLVEEGGEARTVEDVADDMVTGFTNFVADWSPQFEAAEMTVYHPGLKVAGTLDMIVTLGGVAISPAGRLHASKWDTVSLCVDTKTGKHLDVTVREQLAAYRRMTEAHAGLGDLVPLPRTDGSAVLHLRPGYPGGYRLILIGWGDDEQAWQRFQVAAGLHRGRQGLQAKPGKVVYPPGPDGTVPPPRLADLDGEGYGRVLTPLQRAGVADLAQLAAMTAGQCLAVKGVGGKTLDIIRRMLAGHGLHLAGETTAPPRKAA